MENYKLAVEIEPTNEYQKAKQDLLQALKSYGELTPQEKERLVHEILGAANVAFWNDILKQYFR